MIIQPGQEWQHYSGTVYTILHAHAWCTRTGNGVVIYRDEAGSVWVRDMGEFLGYTPDHKKRFTLVRGIYA